MLQLCDVAPQAAPPLAAGVVTVRVCVPPPQLVLHPLHPLTTQSTGHPCVLHGTLCDKAGHAAPPFAGCVVTVLVCVAVPPPHAAEQEPWLPHPLTTQSTAPLLGAVTLT